MTMTTLRQQSLATLAAASLPAAASAGENASVRIITLHLVFPLLPSVSGSRF